MTLDQIRACLRFGIYVPVAELRAALASVDTRRMAETVEQGSVRSTGSAVPNGETPNA